MPAAKTQILKIFFPRIIKRNAKKKMKETNRGKCQGENESCGELKGGHDYYRFHNFFSLIV